jgi:hypothetical protein
MMGKVYTAPPNAGSVLAGATLIQRARAVPSVSHGKHFISIAEQSFCSSQQARWQLLYLVAKDLHQKPDIQVLKSDMLQSLGKLVTEKPVDFVGFDNVVNFNKNRQNDDNVVKAYKS